MKCTVEYNGGFLPDIILLTLYSESLDAFRFVFKVCSL